MKIVFECLSHKYGGSYKLLFSRAGMIETSAASHFPYSHGILTKVWIGDMILKFILNGILPLNRIENR